MNWKRPRDLWDWGKKQPKTGYISKLHSESDNITVVHDDGKEEIKQPKPNICKLDNVKSTVKKTKKPCTKKQVANEGKDVSSIYHRHIEHFFHISC